MKRRLILLACACGLAGLILGAVWPPLPFHAHAPPQPNGPCQTRPNWRVIPPTTFRRLRARFAGAAKAAPKAGRV